MTAKASSPLWLFEPTVISYHRPFEIDEAGFFVLVLKWLFLFWSVFLLLCWTVFFLWDFFLFDLDLLQSNLFWIFGLFLGDFYLFDRIVFDVVHSPWFIFQNLLALYLKITVADCLWVVVADFLLPLQCAWIATFSLYFFGWFYGWALFYVCNRS